MLHTTVWVAGTQKGDEQRCTVTIHGSVQSYDKYELLENVDNAARVNWQHWDKYKPTPIGAVATENMFIARHAAHGDKGSPGATPRYTYYIGTLNSDNLGSISYVKDVSNCSGASGWETVLKSAEGLMVGELLAVRGAWRINRRLVGTRWETPIRDFFISDWIRQLRGGYAESYQPST